MRAVSVLLGGAALVCVFLAIMPGANAYVWDSTKWCNTPTGVYIWNQAPSGTDDWHAIDTGWRVWSAEATQVQFNQGSSSYFQVNVYTGNWATTWAAQSLTYADSNGCRSTGWTQFNDLVAGQYPLAKKIEVMAHEMGHIQGLQHSERYDALMYGPDVFSSRPYLAPVYDDIKGIQALYPPARSSSFSSQATYQGGYVTRDASGLPTKVGVSPSGSGSYVWAGTNYQSFPTGTGAVVMHSYVNANPAYRGAMCICWSMNPTSTTNRMYNLEIDNDKFAVTYALNGGGFAVQPVQNGSITPVPQAGVNYYLTLVAFPDGAGGVDSYGYVHDTRTWTEVGHTPMNVGTTWKFDGTNTYSMGFGAWTDSASNPAPAYNLGQQWGSWS